MIKTSCSGSLKITTVIMATQTAISMKQAQQITFNKSVIIGSFIAGGLIFYNSWKKYANIASLEFLTKCPKLELHAHLHGSIRMKTLAELYENASKNKSLKHIIKKNENPKKKIESILKKHKSFNEVFALFDVIHRVVCSKDVLIRIINEVLIDFAQQNVKYLELRSTPRCLSHSGHSRKEYVEIILNEIRNFPLKYPKYKDMIIRFLVTIQNAKPLEEGKESLDIIEEYLNNNNDNENIIVGIDFAPRPIKNKCFKYYENILNRARKMGLKITIHFAEFYDRNEQDLVLNFKPERLGHAVNLKYNDYEYLLNNPIPIEMCPTSNIYTKSISNYSNHPYKTITKRFKKKYGKKYPMLFCTDDFGVFQTNLISEWQQMCNAHYLTKYDVKNITMNAINFIFASEKTKQKLRSDMENAWNF